MTHTGAQIVRRRADFDAWAAAEPRVRGNVPGFEHPVEVVERRCNALWTAMRANSDDPIASAHQTVRVYRFGPDDVCATCPPSTGRAPTLPEALAQLTARAEHEAQGMVERLRERASAARAAATAATREATALEERARTIEAVLAAGGGQ